MSGWHQTTLGEFLSLQRGHDLPSQDRVDGDIPVMGSFGITGSHDKSRAKGPGVTVGRSGASIGTVSYIDEDYWPLNTCMYVTDFKGNDPRFVYHLLGTLDLARFNSGSAQPSLNRNYIYPMEIVVPSAKEQREIAATLGALDDKIELNRKTAAVLEEMARALYRSWFVDFDPVRARAEGRAPAHMDAATAALFPDSFGEDGLPVGWHITEVQKEVDVAIGKTPPRREPEHFTDSTTGFPWLSIRDMGTCGVFTEGSAEGLTPQAIKQFNVAIAPKGTVLLSFKLTVGRLAIASQDLCTNEAIAHMKIRTGSDLNMPFLYSFLRAFNFDQLASTSSIATAVNSKTIKAMPLLVPTPPVCAAFEKRSALWFSRIAALTAENRTLATLRDTLLPRLMSGELRVGAAREMVDEVA